MTVGELYNQVVELGFEESIEDVDGFYDAVNRAILQVNNVKPAIGYYVINHRPLTNLVPNPTFEPIAKTDDLTFEAQGAKSYYFEADGKGDLYVELYDDAEQSWRLIDNVKLDANHNFVAYKGFIKNDGAFVGGHIRLRFSGEYLYYVRNVALYDVLYSGDRKDIPAYEPFTRYDLRTLTGDFLGLYNQPVSEGEEHATVVDYEVEDGSVILIPYAKGGLYKIAYYRLRRAVINEGDTESTEEIDIDADLASIIPLLVAAYIWLDDEPQRSEYYMSLYEQRAGEIRASLLASVRTAPVKMKNRNGW